MKITSITEEDRKRCKIAVDGVFYCLLYKGEIRRLSIKEGMECSREWLEQLDETVLIPRAKSYCMHLVERQERTEHQLFQKLKEHQYPEHIAQTAISFWKEKGCIGDLGYAGRYISYRYESESYRRICEKLYQKGISREVVAAAWEHFSDELQSREEEMSNIALQKTIEKKSRSLDCSDPVQKQKMIRFLMGRGFYYQEIMKELTKIG